MPCKFIDINENWLKVAFGDVVSNIAYYEQNGHGNFIFTFWFFMLVTYFLGIGDAGSFFLQLRATSERCMLTLRNLY